MKPHEFCVDADIPNLLVFAPGTNLTGPLLDDFGIPQYVRAYLVYFKKELTVKDIIIQDKASCFSAFALIPPNLADKPTGTLIILSTYPLIASLYHNHCKQECWTHVRPQEIKPCTWPPSWVKPRTAMMLPRPSLSLLSKRIKIVS